MMMTMMMERVAAVLASASIKSFLVLALAGLIVSSWRRSSAASRHFVWTAAVLAIIALPVLGAVVPAWKPSVISLRIPQSLIATVQRDATKPAIITDRVSMAVPAGIAIGATTPSRANTPSEASTADRLSVPRPTRASSEPAGAAEFRATSTSGRLSLRASEITAIDAQVSAAAASILPDRQHSPRETSWSQLAATIWLTGFVLVLLPFCVARLRLRRIASTARVMNDGRWVTLLTRIRATGEFTRHVTLLESDETTMPMTWGFISPVLLLPSRTSEWSERECRNILLHELAHIDRLDCLTQMIAQVACALYWFNPLAWVAAHRMCVERELACDDRVIGTGSRPSEYAGQLLDVARSLRPARATAHAAIAMARPSQLSGRLTAVLDRERNRQRVSGGFRATAAVTTLAFLLPLASLTPWVNAAEAAPAHAAARTARSPMPAHVQRSATAFEPGSVVTLVPPGVTGGRASGVPPLEMREMKPLTTTTAFRTSASIGLMPIIEAVQSSDGALGLVRESAPVVQGTNCWESRKDQSTSINSHDDGSRTKRITVKFSSGSCTLELHADGDFTLRTDLSDVATLERGATLTLEERDGSSTRRIEIRNKGNGLEHLYFVNGRSSDYSPEARAWLATTLLAVERRTAFAAATRVPQIFEGRGARGVLDEVSLMPSDYAKSAYLTVLLKQGISFDAPTLTRIVQQSAREMTSDYYKAEVFKQVGGQRLADEGTWRAFADAAIDMKSDYYKSMVISSVLSRDRLDAGTVATLLKAASTIGSDYYQAETLKSMSKRYAITAQSRPYYLAALGKIGSDYYKYEVLTFLNTNENLDAATTAAILKSVGQMTSDYYKSEALAMLSRRGRLDPATRDDYLAAVRSISSDYYKHQVLNAMLAERPLTRETVAGILALAPSIKSDYELSTLLSSVARAFPIDDSLRPAFNRAVDAIGSDYYRNAAAAARSGTR
jgi:beta-lactamase regulating signal transducer with metallopeptidase domain